MQSLIPKPLTAPALNAFHIQKFSKSKGRKWNIACVVAERVPVIFLMNEDVDGTLNACYVESGIKNEY